MVENLLTAQRDHRCAGETSSSADIRTFCRAGPRSLGTVASATDRSDCCLRRYSGALNGIWSMPSRRNISAVRRARASRSAQPEYGDERSLVL